MHDAQPRSGEYVIRDPELVRIVEELRSAEGLRFQKLLRDHLITSKYPTVGDRDKRIAELRSTLNRNADTPPTYWEYKIAEFELKEIEAYEKDLRDSNGGE